MTHDDHDARIAMGEIRGGVPIADAAELEAIADAAHARAEGPYVEELARGSQISIHIDADLPPMVGGILCDGRHAVVRPRRDRRRLLMRILHEIAHQLLLDARIGHSHGDVWALTLALAAPRSMLRQLRRMEALTLPALCWTTDVPAWAVRERLAMPTAA